MASSSTSTWKSPFSVQTRNIVVYTGSSWQITRGNQETLETKTFTWRLRPHFAQFPNGDQNISKNIKSSSVSGSSASRLLTPTSGQTTSSSITSSNSHQSFEQHNPFLRYQEFEVEAGHSMGLHSMWSLFLVSCGSTIPGQRSNTNVSVAALSAAASVSSSNSDFVELFLRKMLNSSGNPQSGYTMSRSDEILVRYKIEIMDRDGEVLYTKNCETSAKDKSEVCYWHWNKIVPVSKFHNNPKGKSQTRESIGQDSAEESILLLRVSFVLVSRRKNKGAPGLPTTEEDASIRDAANVFLSLVTNTDPNPKSLHPDVVIEITNRRKFFVHKKVLVGRSPVFSKLLGVDMNGKTRGVMKVEDISANTMELILKHIYTGQLEEEWTTNPVTATELIYASEKYGLPAMKEFCNKHLVKAATKNNCYKLMEVAQLHNLEKAADDLKSYVSEGISSNSNSRKPSEESVAG